VYSGALFLHSWIRWAVLVLGVIAVWQALRSRNGWSPAADRAGALFTGGLDLQMVIGLLLYFWLSPNLSAMRHDFGAAMQQPALRFWLVEHPTGMVLALAFAHIGRVRVRRAPEQRKRRTALIFFTLALVLTLASIPWPGLPYGRTLVRSPLP
jgi:hypothetical protein